MNEFDLISHFFTEQQDIRRTDVSLGIGDDCAILHIPKGQELLISIDTLVNGVHFPQNTAPFDIGYKALAVNLSDLAAMGAVPAWFSLALTLPSVDKSWLAEFSKGLFTLAQQFAVQLIGGDTTRGPLSITIQAHGLAAKGKSIRRQGAQEGDLIYVTNTLGDAGLALRHIQQQVELPPAVFKAIAARLNRPIPRVKEGLLVGDYATAMIDLSDGLISDLGHILKQSQVGALINVQQIPLSNHLKQAVTPEQAIQLALSAGDDYELCCTIPAALQQPFEQWMRKNQASVQCIGQINDSKTLSLQHHGRCIDKNSLRGYSHF